MYPMKDYNIEEITDTYLGLYFSEGNKYISQFPLEVKRKVSYELLNRAGKFFKKSSETYSNSDSNCSEHGCLEDHF